MKYLKNSVFSSLSLSRLVFCSIVFLLSSDFLLAQEEVFPNENLPHYQHRSPKLYEIEKSIINGNYKESQLLLDEYQNEPLTDSVDSLEYVYSILMQYEMFYQQNRYQEAVPYLQKSTQLIKEWGISNNILKAHNIYMWANLYYQMDNSMLDRCIAAVNAAQEIYKKGPFQSRPLYNYIVGLKYRAYAYSRKAGSTDSVFKYLDIRKEIYAKYNNLIPAFSKDNVVSLWGFYAEAFSKVGDFNQSISYNMLALKMLEEQGDYESGSYIYTLLWLGIAHYYNEDFKNSLIYTRKAANLDLKNLAPDHPDMVQYYNLTGLNYEGLEQLDSALFWLKKCQRIIEKTDTDNSAITEILNTIGSIKTKTKNFGEAKDYLHRALSENKRLFGPKHANNAQSYKYLHNYYKAKGQHKVALAYIDSALQRLEPSHTGDIFSTPDFKSTLVSHETLEILYEHVSQQLAVYKHDTNGYEHFEAAVKKLDLIQQVLDDRRKAQSDTETTLSRSDKFKSASEAIINALHKLYQENGEQQLDNILGHIATSKSRSLLDEISEFEILSQPEIPNELRTEFLYTKSQIEILNNQLNELLSTDIDNDSIRALNSQKRVLSDRFTKVREILLKDYPSTNRLLNPSSDLPEILKYYELQDDDEAIIEYFVGKEYISIIAVSKSKKSVFQVPHDSIFDVRFSNTIEQISTDRNINLSQFKESAHYLYSKLLSPALTYLGNDIKRLTIIPDEKLHLLPFELLLRSSTPSQNSFKDLDYLIKDFTVSYKLLSTNINEKTNAPSGNGILGFAYQGEGISDERAELGGLPGAIEEIDFLEKNFKGAYYRGKRGSKEQFLKEVGKYDVVHLALHGKADLENRLNSTLIFNGDDNYNLNSYDLYGVKLNTSLVVLSACESGVGKLSTSEGSFSVARGFASVGVPSIVTTLWKVNDQASATIVKSFYKNLKKGEYKDEALRNAKLSFLENSDNIFANPYYWGSYIVIGDVSPVELKEASDTRLYLTFSLLMALVVIIVATIRKKRNQS